MAKRNVGIGERIVSQNIGIPGIVRNGVVVPQTNQPLPEGSHVEIRLESTEIPKTLLDEIASWEAASDESWCWIDKMEAAEK